jgi:hypothetical protein
MGSAVSALQLVNTSSWGGRVKSPFVHARRVTEGGSHNVTGVAPTGAVAIQLCGQLLLERPGPLAEGSLRSGPIWLRGATNDDAQATGQGRICRITRGRVSSIPVTHNYAVNLTVPASRPLRSRLRPTSPLKVARKGRATWPAGYRERYVDFEKEVTTS